MVSGAQGGGRRINQLSRTELGLRLLRDTTWILGFASAALAVFYIQSEGWGADSRAYWMAWHGPAYTTGPMTKDAYLYSPAFAQLIWPLAQLPWPVFAGIVSLTLGVVLVWLLRPLGWRWAVPLWLAGLPEIVSGNIFILLALAAVSFSRPPAWALPALTKVTVCVGPVWYLARREWASLAKSLLAIAVIAGVSVLISPQLWADWMH